MISLFKIKNYIRHVMPFMLMIFTVCTSLDHDIKEIDDARIADAVKFEFRLNKLVPADNIQVTCENGIVLLKGEVPHLLAQDKAVEMTEMIKGVRSVINQLQVEPARRNDFDLIKDITIALQNDPVTESYEVGIEAENGIVVLTGTVDSWSEKQLVEQVVKQVRGIAAIDNQIDIIIDTVRPDEEIKTEIENKFYYDVLLQAGLIEVNVENGNVRLSGKVGSAAEKNRAIRMAHVAGVKAVDSEHLKAEHQAYNKMKRQDTFVLLEDPKIKSAVQDAFKYDPRVKEAQTEIDVENGVVTLTGFVDNLKARRAAGHDARNTLGVIRVDNQLKVRPKKEYSDSEITARIKNVLKKDPYTELFKINVVTIDGNVHLNGRVNSYFEKQRIEDLASVFSGVLNVDNDIEVNHTSMMSKTDEMIAQDLKDQLFWNFYIDEEAIHVDVKEGKVTLTGQADNKMEVLMIVRDAFEVGAKQVQNRMHIKTKEEEIQFDRFYFNPHLPR